LAFIEKNLATIFHHNASRNESSMKRTHAQTMFTKMVEFYCGCHVALIMVKRGVGFNDVARKIPTPKY